MNKKLRNTLLIAAATSIALLLNDVQLTDNNTVSTQVNKNLSTKAAFLAKKSDTQVKGEGKVIKVLKDDTKGSRHQKFILSIDAGFTVLIAHNIDLAPRIKNIAKGDLVEFYGEYEYNAKGGVIHWTHKDPNNRHEHGWLKHQGEMYQ